jgi:hypothetical protein
LSYRDRDQFGMVRHIVIGIRHVRRLAYELALLAYGGRVRQFPPVTCKTRQCNAPLHHRLISIVGLVAHFAPLSFRDELEGIAGNLRFPIEMFELFETNQSRGSFQIRFAGARKRLHASRAPPESVLQQMTLPSEVLSATRHAERAGEDNRRGRRRRNDGDAGGDCSPFG